MVHNPLINHFIRLSFYFLLLDVEYQSSLLLIVKASSNRGIMSLRGGRTWMVQTKFETSIGER